MSKYDIQYNQMVKEILEDGVWDKGQEVRARWFDGTPAYSKSLVTYQLKIDTSEVPILTTKHVAWKSAITEILWLYVKRTSDVTYLRENKVKIWEPWTSEVDYEWSYPNIGRAYGYQLGKPILVKSKIEENNVFYKLTNQVHNLINELKNNPASRRHVISLWNIDDLHAMNLYPCVWTNQWVVQNNKLHLVVTARSNDIGIGNPFNVFQYYVLQRMIAQVTGYEMGTLTFNLTCPHIYDRHIEPLKEQINREPYSAPELWINPEIKDIDDFTINDFKLINYQHHPKIEMEVAI